jgi:carbon-monoxide dehydrogenase medium subunit
VRNRGTVGGSLAHADPAADWLSALIAIGAEILITSVNGRRRVSLPEFIRGAMETELRHGEIIDGVRIPRFAKGARAAFAKICRKTGEFAEAIGVVFSDPEHGTLRLVAGATQGQPIAIDVAAPSSKSPLDLPVLREELRGAGFVGDAYELNLHAVALARALEKRGQP